MVAHHEARFQFFDADHGGGKRRAVNLALWLRDAFPSAVRSYQPLTFYPALAYGVDNNRIGSANFIGVGNRGLSGIVYRIKVACGAASKAGITPGADGLAK